jgi:uncharacterized FAD-dependent dehydrogenase
MDFKSSMTNEYFYHITNFRISFRFKETLKEQLALDLELPIGEILFFKIIKESLDARQNRKDIYFQYKILFSLAAPLKNIAEKKNIESANPPVEPPKLVEKNILYQGKRPIIIGYGPAGMFAAYTLINAGIKPIIIEKGLTVDDRQKDINQLWKNGTFKTDSNVQFGEGGAGFYSDGKLGTRVSSPYIQDVYRVFIQFGAKSDILYENKPHLGTDKLKGILRNFRQYLIDNGVEFHFNTSMKEILFDKNRQITGVQLEDGRKMETETVFLCTGHSSRKVYRMLHEKGVQLEAKEFAVGFRIEHPQSFINLCQYGTFFEDPYLPAADYKLQNHLKDKNQGTYSFCMCPGGMVVLATSEEGKIVTNGMSLSRRAGKFANAGIVVTANHELYGEGLLAGMEFQEAIEKKAYDMTGSYFGPAQRVIDFLENRTSETLPKSSYLPGIKSVNLNLLYPESINTSIREAMYKFDEKFKGFIQPDAIFIAPETRTSSPLKIPRDPLTYVSVNTPGLIPLGEGAGAAGGITSAGIEGINGALFWLKGLKGIKTNANS